MRKEFTLALAVVGSALAFGTGLSAQSAKPVMVGGEVEFDACGATGIVVGLDPQGDNFLAVRAGPGSKYKTIDKISGGQSYSDCDRHGKWVGIVYSNDPQVDCGVGTPIATRQPYSGPCKSGWVFRKYTKLIAG